MTRACFGLLLLLVSAPALAQVYSCPDGRGGKVYQQSPCAGAAATELRCWREDGTSYVSKEATCPAVTPPTPVTMGTAAQAVDGEAGGIAAESGAAASPPAPRRELPEQVEPVGGGDACDEARTELAKAQSHPQRNVSSVRRAEAQVARFCR